MMSPRRTGRQRWVRQCSGHVYRLDLLLRQQQNAFDPIVIIIEVSYRIVYRDNFDLSYRLSIGNSIWHIVTALIIINIEIVHEVHAEKVSKKIKTHKKYRYKSTYFLKTCFDVC